MKKNIHLSILPSLNRQLCKALFMLFSFTVISCLAFGQEASEIAGCRKYTEVTWLMAHNAFANPSAGFIHTQQNMSLSQQLEFGVRGFMLDVYTKDKVPNAIGAIPAWVQAILPTDGVAVALEGELAVLKASLDQDGVYLFHNIPQFPYPGIGYPNIPIAEHLRFSNYLNTIGNWLVQHPDEIVTINLEWYADTVKMRKELELVSAGIRQMIFNDFENLNNVTVQQLRNTNKRLIILSSHIESDGKYRDVSYKVNSDSIVIGYVYSHTVENTYNVDAEINSCEKRSESSELNSGKPLTFNHFAFISTFVSGEQFNPSIINRWLDHCLSNIPIPTFLAVDFVEEGTPSPMDAVREFNRLWIDINTPGAPVYNLKNVLSEKYIGKTGSSAGSDLTQSTAAESWAFHYNPDDHTYFISLVNDANKVIGITYDVPFLQPPRAEIQSKTGENNQRFHLEPRGGNQYEIREKGTNTYYCLTVTGLNGEGDLIERQNAVLGNELHRLFELTEVSNGSSVTAKCKNITAYLPSNGDDLIIEPEVVNNNSTYSGCLSLSLNIHQFSCSNIGSNSVTLTASNGDVTSTCTATVTIIDNTLPTAVCKSVVLELNANGTGSITPTQVGSNSTDNCGISNLTLNKSSFSCSDVGSLNQVQLTVFDGSGNNSSCQSNVVVVDNVAPSAKCKSASIQLNDNGEGSIDVWDIDNNSSDACGISSRLLSKNYFDCSNLGDNTVILTVKDANANINSCLSSVSVVDLNLPTPLCQNIAIFPDANGNYPVDANLIDNGSYDNCGIASISVAPSLIPCFHESYEQAVILTVTDIYGNENTCTATVSLLDDDDCDGVGNTCDLCPGGNDQVDNDNDGNPDCHVYPGFSNLESNWICSNNSNKVLLCHNGNTICVHPNSVASHLSHGDYLGPCDEANCDGVNPMALSGSNNTVLPAESMGAATTQNWQLKTYQSVENFGLYPNPAQHEFTILVERFLGKEVDVIVSDAFGRIVYQIHIPELNENTLTIQELDDWKNGLYNVSVVHGGRAFTKRLVVSKF